MARWNFFDPDESTASVDGALVCIVDGELQYLKFDDLMDPQTKKTTVRPVDISKPSYKVAREYMIRLEREDFEIPHAWRNWRRGVKSRTAAVDREVQQTI